jgi:hypothetical protein
MFAFNPALPTFFLALCLAAGPKNPQRDSLAKQLWQTFKRDMVQNFKAQLEDCRKHRFEYGVRTAAHASSSNLRVDEF